MSTVVVFLLVLVYFLPALLAAPRRRASVFILNLFAGWTLLGWVIALFMAARSREAT